MDWLKRLLRREGAQQLPTVKAHPDRPVPVNPPWRKDFETEAEYLSAIRHHTRTLKEWERQRRIGMGITHFVWRHHGGPPCSVGARLNGRKFDYRQPPNEGLPGASECDHDYCRYCIAMDIIPGFD